MTSYFFYLHFFGLERKLTVTNLSPRLMIAEEINKYINADSLAYLQINSLIRAARQKAKNLCTACFNGNYPVPIDVHFTKSILETSTSC